MIRLLVLVDLSETLKVFEQRCSNQLEVHFVSVWDILKVMWYKFSQAICALETSTAKLI